MTFEYKVLDENQLTNEAVLPTQLYTSPLIQSGPHRLLLAILIDAVDQLSELRRPYRHDSINHRRWKDSALSEVEQWVLSDRVDFGSFVFCCQHLGLAPDRLRKALLERGPGEQSLKRITMPGPNGIQPGMRKE